MNEQELEEYKSYLIAQGTPEGEASAYIEYVKAQEPKKGTIEKAKDLGLSALSGAAKVLDYTGGLARTTAATGLGQAGTEEWKKALVGEAPTTSEYLEKAGVPSGASLSELLPGMYSESGEGLLKFKKGGTLDPTARGAAGFVGDVALDPLTYLSFGAAPAAKAAGKLGKAGDVLQTVASPLQKGAAKTGPGIYKSALKKVEREAAKYGKEPVSDVLMKYGVWGSAESIQKQMDDLASRLAERQQKALVTAGEQGAQASMQRATNPLMEYIEKLKETRSPETKQAAEQLLEQAQTYMQLDPRMVDLPTGQLKTIPTKPVSIPTGRTLPGYPGAGGYQMEEALMSPLKYGEETVPAMTRPVSPLEAAGFKTDIYETLPKGTYAEQVAKAQGVSPAYTEGRKTLARGMKEETERLAPEIKQVNDELGRILTTKDKQEAAAWLEKNKNLVTQVDASMAGYAAQAGSPAIWAALLAKQIGKVMQLSGVRTGAGLGLERFGKSKWVGPTSDVLLREKLRQERER